MHETVSDDGAIATQLIVLAVEMMARCILPSASALGVVVAIVATLEQWGEVKSEVSVATASSVLPVGQMPTESATCCAGVTVGETG